jgi:hypothetical protein
MYKHTLLFAALLCLILSCQKPILSLRERIQGTWVRGCGCTGAAYTFTGDSIYLTDTLVGNYRLGYMSQDSAYIDDCPICARATPTYRSYPLSLSADGQKLTIPGLCGEKVLCADVTYHKR